MMTCPKRFIGLLLVAIFILSSWTWAADDGFLDPYALTVYEPTSTTSEKAEDPFTTPGMAEYEILMDTLFSGSGGL